MVEESSTRARAGEGHLLLCADEQELELLLLLLLKDRLLSLDSLGLLDGGTMGDSCTTFGTFLLCSHRAMLSATGSFLVIFSGCEAEQKFTTFCP